MPGLFQRRKRRFREWPDVLVDVIDELTGVDQSIVQILHRLAFAKLKPRVRFLQGQLCFIQGALQIIGKRLYLRVDVYHQLVG